MYKQERRRDPRTVMTAMSEVFVAAGKLGHLRYLGPAIVVDISDSGMALVMDFLPDGYNILHVRNYYFHVEIEIRNATPVEGGIRLGAEFTSKLEWNQSQMVSATP
jgi:hypothetical protein